MLNYAAKILIIKLRDIGDIVLSTPVISALHGRFHNPEITYLLKKEYSTFRYILPHVSDVITYDRNDPLDFIRVVAALRARKFDLCVNLHASFRSALLALLSGAKFRLVHNHSGKDYFTSVPLNIDEKQKNIIVRDMETLLPLGIKADGDARNVRLSVDRSRLDGVDTSEWDAGAGLGIGASRPNKVWSREKFVRLGNMLSSVGLRPVIFCSEKERKDGEYISSRVAGSALCAGFDFLRLSLALSSLSVFIGNDSGLRHMAAALGRKTVTIFGAENPIEWHPYKPEHGHIAISRLTEFNEKGTDVLSREFREKSFEPINSISEEEVFAAVMGLLNASGK